MNLYDSRYKLSPLRVSLMTSALHIYPSTFTHESRILKETKSLVDSGLFERIYIGAIWDDGLAENEQLDNRRSVRRVPLRTRKLPGILGKLLRFVEWYLRVFFEFRCKQPKFLNCHSLSVLPLGLFFNWFCGSRLIYDTHELETETMESNGLRRIMARVLERALIGQVEAVIVVSNSIGKWYRDTYNLKNVHVVRNIPEARPSTARKSGLLRQTFGIGDNELLFICQGIMDEGRGINIIMKAFACTEPDRHVVFLGNGPLESEVADWSKRYTNIHHHSAVSPQELLEFTSGADVGISLIENACLSYYYCLPNKMFEYLICGLPVIVSDFPEMAGIIDENGCGWKSSVSADSLSWLLKSMTLQDIAEKLRAAQECSKKFSWHNEERVLICLYEKLLGKDAGKLTSCMSG